LCLHKNYYLLVSRLESSKGLIKPCSKDIRIRFLEDPPRSALCQNNFDFFPSSVTVLPKIPNLPSRIELLLQEPILKAIECPTKILVPAKSETHGSTYDQATISVHVGVCPGSFDRENSILLVLHFLFVSGIVGRHYLKEDVIWVVMA